ncbi:MAG: UDP-N-acetylglucosamine pyrophosphorylase [Clostridia bacterium]|nr:UDP-N-acetylglucosamine pyrophosphorylase [Clostridia bacterium]
MLTVSDLYDLSHTRLRPWLETATYPWEILADLATHIRTVGATLSPDRFDKREGDVWIAKTATVAPSAHIGGPCIIDEDAEIRHGAFIRGNAVVGKGAVVGNSTELKNCVLFDGVQVPHYNYVGDSILGYKAHLGAGAVTSNVKSDKSPVTVRDGDDCVATDRKKCGAMVGDFAEVGCNSVLNPGTVLGRHTQVYPTSCVRGTVPPHHIYKDATHIILKRSDT